MGGQSHPSTVPQVTTVEFYILLSLLAEEQHGLGLIKDISRRTDGELFLSPGTLYAALKRMYKDKSIAESERTLPDANGNQERRRYYRLTSKGKAMIEAELERIEALAHLTRKLLKQSASFYHYQPLHPISYSISP